MTSTERARTAILVITIAGGLAGGLLGSTLTDLGSKSLVLLLLVGTAIGVTVALLLTTEAAQRPDAAPPQPGPPAPEWTPPPAKPDAANHIAALPLPPEAEGRKWWNEATPRGATNRSEVSAAAPPLSSYAAERALIAQCPRCGDFRLDVNGGAHTYAFRCHHCGNAWQWAPGTPWPAVVVRRNLTRK